MVNQQELTLAKAKGKYKDAVRIIELEADIKKITIRLNRAKTFEATLALKKLLDRLQHERRITK